MEEDEIIKRIRENPALAQKVAEAMKPVSTQSSLAGINVPVTGELRGRLEKLAAEDKGSLSGYVLKVLTEHVEQHAQGATRK